MSTRSVTYCRHPNALWRRLASSVVVLGPDADAPRAITGPGAEIWDLLAVPITLADVAARLAAAHGATPGDVRADVEPVLDLLVHDGAVECRS